MKQNIINSFAIFIILTIILFFSINTSADLEDIDLLGRRYDNLLFEYRFGRP